MPVVVRHGDLAISVADAAIAGDLTYRYIGLDRAGQLQALVVGLAQALGVAAAFAAVHSAVLGLGPSLQWQVGADVAGADPAQVVAMTPTARLDHVRAVGDRTSGW